MVRALILLLLGALTLAPTKSAASYMTFDQAWAACQHYIATTDFGADIAGTRCSDVPQNTRVNAQFLYTWHPHWQTSTFWLYETPTCNVGDRITTAVRGRNVNAACFGGCEFKPRGGSLSLLGLTAGDFESTGQRCSHPSEEATRPDRVCNADGSICWELGDPDDREFCAQSESGGVVCVSDPGCARDSATGLCVGGQDATNLREADERATRRPGTGPNVNVDIDVTVNNNNNSGPPNWSGPQPPLPPVDVADFQPRPACGGPNQPPCPTCGEPGLPPCSQCGGPGQQPCANCGVVGQPPCPVCGVQGLPPCPTCGVVGQPPCPVCGIVGLPPCPLCDVPGQPPCPVCGTPTTPPCPTCGVYGQPPCPSCGVPGLPDCPPCGGPGQPPCSQSCGLPGQPPCGECGEPPLPPCTACGGLGQPSCSSVSGGHTCEEAPVCSGDAATCNILWQVWADRCNFGEPGGGDLELPPDDGTGNIQPSDIISSEPLLWQPDTGGFGGAGACPVIDLPFVSASIDLAPVCGLIDILGYMVILLATFTGARIIGGVNGA